MQRPTTKVIAKPITNSKLCSHSNQPVQVDKSDEDIPELEDQWPKVACLTLGRFLKQGDVIHEICQDAIWIVKATLVIQHAWPELHKGTLQMPGFIRGRQHFASQQQERRMGKGVQEST